MYKQIISPLQQWLLSQGRCVGCGKPLKSGQEKQKDGIILVTCSCRRIFIYSPESNSYRRALLSEAS